MDSSDTVPNACSGYAFLNHSASTLPNNLPPDVHNKSLARQKRKRTSPEDQAVLEAAYQRDPKPDTEGRRQLSHRVALGEKEVQIWFQNRRQSARRKTRPLLPHEVAQYQASRSVASSPSVGPVPSNETQQDPSRMIANGRGVSISAHDHLDLQDGFIDGVQKQSRPVDVFAKTQDGVETDHAQHSQEKDDKPSMNQSSPQPALEPSETISLPPASASKMQSIGYLANRRNAALLQSGLDEHLNEHTQDETSARTLKRPRSSVRLSMTSEGNARIVQLSLSPSPPRALQSSDHHTANAKSAGPETSEYWPTRGIPTPKLLQRSASGRSRDSRTWEFWCDKEARLELEEKAEKDGSGSAADAIGLMRSNSGRRVLGNLSSKRNSILERSSAFAKRHKVDRPRASLQRSGTSGGRLQGRAKSFATAKTKLKSSASAVSVYVHGNESDKENWSPTAVPYTSQQLATGYVEEVRPSVVHDALHDKHGLNAGRTRRHVRSERTKRIDNRDLENDPELIEFMGGERRSSNATQEDDMDCVHGLLSLSQGNWK